MRKLVIMALALLFALSALSAAESIASLKAASEAAAKAATAAPADYAANWMAARAFRKYGDELVKTEAPGWKDIAKPAAKEGMKFGDIAQKLNPRGVEGWYWYGVCVGTYSDCVSIITALTEGLKGKTQKSFETAYSLNKMYEEGGPILSLGRFWQVLPGIAGKDLKKAEQLFTEYIGLFGSSKEPNEDAWYYRGSLYKEIGKTPEARAALQKAASMGQKDAAKLLGELK
jgi:tetratricopeptide (TPR) repeat protein